MELDDKSPIAASKRVLIVDDDIDTAWSQALLLRSSGHDVRVAHDGHEAVEIAREFRPEVVLLDLVMPRLNGYEAARCLREAAGRRGVLIVAISGCARECDVALAREAGCDRHLTKPADPATVERMLSEGAGGDAAMRVSSGPLPVTRGGPSARGPLRRP